MSGFVRPVYADGGKTLNSHYVQVLSHLVTVNWGWGVMER